ncbi:MAG: hypothetical protein DME26_12730 [Verrucomicrobia bacterium]|nr:MAG: hypothetical protein DME26_12730 [Verrucomicrobiota bacterium]
MTIYFLILFGFLGLGVAGWVLVHRGRAAGQIVMTIGCIGAFTLLARELYLNVFMSSPKAPDRYHAIVAYMMGHQVAGELGDQRGQVMVILPPESTVNNFARVLAPFSGLELKQAALRPGTDPAKNGATSLEAFEQAIGVAPNALAYVSFAGAPTALEKLSLFKKENPPALFVYDPTGGNNWAEPLKKRLIRRVIVARPQLAPTKGKAMAASPDELFQRYFLWATPETADEIAEQLRDR